jgi:O-phosphoseryl-tRNA(Cys) synthetase
LPLVDLQADTLQGQWEQSAGSLRVRAKPITELALPLIVDGSYELEVTLKRQFGQDAFALLGPAGSTMTGFSVGNFRTLGAIIGVDMAQANMKEHVELEQQATLSRMKVEVDGDNVSITCFVNDLPLRQWNGPVSSLTPAAVPEFKTLQSTAPALGLASWAGNDDTVATCRFKLISGQAWLTRAGLKPTVVHKK